jgi:glycosyltransferase involved in cell wall biosynthesis
VLVALHALHTGKAVLEHPGPSVVALTGTDLYLRYGSAVEAVLDRAWRIVVLQPGALRQLPPRLRAKTRVILQSAEFGERQMDPQLVAVVAHLRPVKDPLLAADALQHLPSRSAIRVEHVGQALNPELGELARRFPDPRYRWLGPVPHGDAVALIRRAWILLLTSRSEGGANVLSEALACGTPVLSTDIDAARALLGQDYPGLFPVGDATALAGLLSRAERESSFYRELVEATQRRRLLVAPAGEREAWRALLAELP